MTPCDKEVIIEKLRTEVENIKVDIQRLTTKQDNTDKVVEKIENTVKAIRDEINRGKWITISSSLAVIGFLIVERFF